MLSRGDQRRIMRDDAKRRNAREAIELAELSQASDVATIALNTTPGAYVNPVLVRGIGVVNPPLRVRASAAAIIGPRTVGSKTVGTALDEHGNPVLTDDGRATVKITRDGITTYVAANGYGRAARSTSRRTQTTNRPHHMTCADMAPIGQDYE